MDFESSCTLLGGDSCCAYINVSLHILNCAYINVSLHILKFNLACYELERGIAFDQCFIVFNNLVCYELEREIAFDQRVAAQRKRRSFGWGPAPDSRSSGQSQPVLACFE